MVTFDLRETVIPFLLLRIINHFKRMIPGEVCEILCCDKSTEKDIKRILPRREYECLEVGPSGLIRGGFCFRLRKIRPRTEQERSFAETRPDPSGLPKKEERS